MQHVQKNAARTGGDDFEREIALDPSGVGRQIYLGFACITYYYEVAMR